MKTGILNSNYQLLAESYLFSQIAEKVSRFQTAHSQTRIIRLGIGDVTRPIVPTVIDAMHRAVDEMASSETFRGYGPEQGYLFLREAIAQGEYAPRGVELSPDEIFVSDGSKCDVANFQELFSDRVRIAIPDPVYPVYLDSNVMAGRAGALQSDGHYDNIVYLSANAENDFQLDPPHCPVALIYLCSPNNPTGTVLSRETLTRFVRYAQENGAIILFDAAYANYIQDDALVHTIYEIEGAKECAVEFRSFSKSAGFTGVRCAFTVVPRQMEMLRKMWLRRQTTKFNGVNYIVQRGAAAVYSPEGAAETREVIASYMRNAALIRESLQACGATVYGGKDAPYIWWKLPRETDSFQFFDTLLENCAVVGTPGGGFGPQGKHYFRLTAFGDPARTKLAMERIAAQKKILF